MTILCCGEALIDMVPHDLAPESIAFQPKVGGAIFNTAIALGRLGERVSFLSGISTDLFGEMLMRALAASNVDTSRCVRSPLPSTLAFVQFDGRDATYTFYDENSAGRCFSVADVPELAELSAVHFGGISLTAEPCGSSYEAIATRLSEQRVISLDPNIRPGFINDERAYRERLRRMMGISDIVKVSEEDLRWLEGDADFENVARRWLESGVSIAVLTRGGGKATAITSHCRVSCLPDLVEVADTIGAGDTFSAGFLVGLRERGGLSKDRIGHVGECDLHHALTLANRAAAVTVSRVGANPPWRHEFEAPEI